MRDLLLLCASPDLDVAVEGPVEEITAALAARLDARVRKTTRFMTSTLLLADGRELDIARTRTESYPQPGALPVVRPATLLDDLRRRDFTVNAMAITLEPERFGELIDPLGGYDDLRLRLLRALHERSFDDDPTRMLRAARFILRLGFSLEERTGELLARAVSERRAAHLSGARLRNELAYIFGESPTEGLATLQALNLLEGIGLAPAPGRACEAARLLPRAAGALGISFGAVDLTAVCLGLYAGLSGQDAAKLAARLMLDACARDALVEAAAISDAPPPVLTEGGSASETFFALRGLCPEAALAAWTVLDGPARSRLELYWRELRAAVADIDGADLIAAGHAPGPDFAMALRAALAAKLDRGADREQQLAVALEALNDPPH